MIDSIVERTIRFEMISWKVKKYWEEEEKEEEGEKEKEEEEVEGERRGKRTIYKCRLCYIKRRLTRFEGFIFQCFCFLSDFFLI